MAVSARTVFARLTLLGVATVFALGLCEVILRVMAPDETFGTAVELPWMRGMDTLEKPEFEISPEFGFLPVMGTTGRSDYGTHANDYDLPRTPGRTRLLFLGDSVTSRGRIIRAIQEIYGDESFEYWNAGVESYNTVQEVAFYKAFNAGIEPDHVILTFHLNDYQTTPAVTRDAEGNMVVYRLNRPASEVNATLFAHSLLYRAILSVGQSRDEDSKTIAREAEASLLELAQLLEREGVAFSVIVLPSMAPVPKWKGGLRAHRRRILKFLKSQGIRHFDLLPALRLALQDGVDVQERPGDVWHPSDAAAGYFARHLLAKGLLDAPELGSRRPM